jgi:hypothetical protein
VEVEDMRTLESVVEFLKKLPHGYSAVGGMLGLGLAAAMDAQKARAADAPAGDIPPRADGDRFARAA